MEPKINSKGARYRTREELIESGKLAVAERQERAEARTALHNGQITIAEILNSDSQAIKRMRVKMLLEACKGIGKTRAEYVLEECRISPKRRIQGLGSAQKERLLNWAKEKDL